MKTTFQKIRDNNPCGDGWRKLICYYKPESFNEEVTIEEIVKSNGIKDAIWALRAVDDKKKIVMFSIAVAKTCLSNFEKYFPNDNRVRKCLEITEKYINDECTLEDLEAAEYAVRSAVRSAWSAVRSARSAWSAAESAARSAEYAARSAEYAVRSAAESAWSYRSAWSAAESAWSYRSSAYDKLKEILIEICQNN
jgi:hypothetical protein